MDSGIERRDGAAAEGVCDRSARTMGAGRAGARALGVHKTRIAPGRPPQVVIVGAGFAGLAAAKRLGRAPVAVTVIDRRNHHLFQPLLYQVATAALSPADIAEPIRAVLRPYRNVEVLLDQVTGIDTAARRVLTRETAAHSYDFLIVATGSGDAYFGHEDLGSLRTGPEVDRGCDRHPPPPAAGVRARRGRCRSGAAGAAADLRAGRRRPDGR
jgi:NADPH-dependent 2,4-dienoyl-CoA reductase/sulfur reductase-like enzyme